jgi:hypothetical protein
MTSNITYTVTTSARVGAPTSRVYGILADYHHGHPRILPTAFTGLTVETGGVGAGTTTRVRMRVFGRSLEFRAVVTEPEPGHVLAETHHGFGRLRDVVHSRRGTDAR